MKNIILLSVFVLISTTAFPQASFGIKAGPMLSNTATADYDSLSFENPNYKVSYLIGAFATLNISNKLSLQTELLYANKGPGTYDRRLPRTSGLHYLSLPIMLQFEAFDNFKIGFGPEISYLLYAEEQIINDYDIAINLGANYTLSDRWLIDFRYNLGLYDIANFNLNGLFDPVTMEMVEIDPRTMNRTFQLTLGYKLIR